MKLSAIKRIENQARHITGVISLAQGIPHNNTHQSIRNQVKVAINKGLVDKYSPVNGLPKLRILICQQLKKKNINYHPESEIIITAGSIEGLSSIFLSIFKSKDEIITPAPTYAYYKKMCTFSGATLVEIKLQESQNWSLNLNQVRERINSHTKAIVLTNPNNPTGTVYSREQLIQLGDLALKHNLYLILDCVYDHFYYPQTQTLSQSPTTSPLNKNDQFVNGIFDLTSIPKYKSIVLKVVSLSKHFCMTGWRIGYLYGPENLIQKILPTHDTLINCAPVVSQYAAIAALTHEQQIVASIYKDYNRKRLLMGQALEQLSDHISFAWPQGAYYFFPKLLKFNNSEKFCFDLLNRAKLATVPGSEFGLGGKGHFRLCFSRSEQDIIEGMSRLKKYFISF